MDRLDFVTTNFGFGPVAKLVAVARALRSLAPEVRLRFLAAGHAFTFGRLSGAFDAHLELDLDRDPELSAAATAGARGVVSSLNFDVLPHLAAERRPVFLLDSLAWLWPELPAGVETAAAYGVQGYLLDSRPERADELPGNSVRLEPILDPELGRLAAHGDRDPELALVNLGGCCNPFVEAEATAAYAVELAQAAVRVLRPRFERIEVHTNRQLAGVIQAAVGDGGVAVRHRSHREFLGSLARCSLLLTTPGITTTLECVALGTPLKFLPPSNYSQYRILEIYHQRRILSVDLRLASFAWGVAVGPDEREADAVRRIGAALAAIRPGDLVAELGGRLEASLEAPWCHELERLRRQPYAAGSGTLELARRVIATCRLAAERPGVEPIVRRLVGNAAGVPLGSLRGSTRLGADLGLSSMGILDLLAELEGAFGFAFGSGEVDITDFHTVERIVAAVSRRLGSEATG